MNALNLQKEILLLTGTTFVKHECGKIKTHNASDSLNQQQILEDACWNGKLPEILPELVNDIEKNKELCLWLIRQGHAYIQLELCEEPLIIEREFSLDPYLFLSSQINN